jgi:hypothetical protein
VPAVVDTNPGRRPSQPTFIVIGAQKSATTSLYNWLRQHPQIYLSQQKELDFFSQDALYEKGFDYYCERWFANTGTAKAIGDVSPHYMLSSAVPQRLARHLPRAQLVAILRNPIDRALSHYLMMKKRGLESRPFKIAATELMQTGRGLISSVHTNYLVAGLYGKTLAEFLQYYPRASLRIMFYEELISEPVRHFASLLEYLGVDPSFIPRDLDKIYNRRAHASRFPAFEAWMMRRTLLKRAIKALVPAEALSRFLFWFDTEFNVRRNKDETDEAMEQTLRERLQDYFQEDVAALQVLCGRATPWSEFAGNAGSTQCNS